MNLEKKAEHFEVLRYSVLATAHLISSLSESEVKRLRSVLLFGSAARLVATKDSDIDIFFDVSAPKKFQLLLRSKLNKSADGFYLTNAALEFKSKGIDNELSIKVGKLEDWEELAENMPSHAIALYSKYNAKPKGAKAYTIMSWETTPKTKGAVLNKIYGYKINKKRYPGLLEKTGSIKIGKATVMAPAQNRDFFIEVFEKYGIDYSRYDVWK